MRGVKFPSKKLTITPSILPELRREFCSAFEFYPELKEIFSQTTLEFSHLTTPLQKYSSVFADLASKRSMQFNFLFYGVTFLEIAGWPRVPIASVPNILANHLLWCLAWREMDEYVDANCLDVRALQCATLALVTASQASFILSQKGHERFALTITRTLSEYFDGITKEKIGDSQQTIWKRGAPFLIVPRAMLKLTPKNIRFIKTYLTLAGLIDDIEDIIEDAMAGKCTVPIRVLNSIDSENSFSLRNIDILRRRLRERAVSLISTLQNNALEHQKVLLEVALPTFESRLSKLT